MHTAATHCHESPQTPQSSHHMEAGLSVFQNVYETLNIYKALFVCETQSDVLDWVQLLEKHDYSCGSVDDLFNRNVRMVVIQASEVKYLLDNESLDTINVVFLQTGDVLKTVLKHLSVLLRNPQYYFVL